MSDYEVLRERIKAMNGKPFVRLSVRDGNGYEKDGCGPDAVLMIPVDDLMGLFDRVKALEEKG